MSQHKIAIILLIASFASRAQEPAPAGPKDVIRNGGFERTQQVPNLWSGVDKDGFLAGFRGFLPVLNETGDLTAAPMPVGVAVGDLNGDGLFDIISSDPLGYVRIYFNNGRKEQPKFTTGQLSLPWLASSEGDPPWHPHGLNPDQLLEWKTNWAARRRGVRASLADLAGNGKLDLVAGNYFGDIFIVRNNGSAQIPRFDQPQSVTQAVVPTTKDPQQRWGNVFAPAMLDWDGDSKVDLLVGEGSYSANNIHLILNQGSNASPVFNEDKRQTLALGEGRQQLTPALADVNGDGKPDILVADRSGRITAYIRPAEWKFGDSISPSGFLSKSGGLSPEGSAAFSVGSGINTISTGDLNNDGLFDLIVGKGANGRIAWAVNKGTKESPQFDTPVDLVGEKPTPPTWHLPVQWEIESGASRGNFLAFANCVSADDETDSSPPGGSRVLKFGYASNTQESPIDRITFPGAKAFRFGEYDQTPFFYDAPLSERIFEAPNRIFMMQQLLQLEAGHSYVLSMRHKGSGIARAHIFIGWWGLKKISEARLVRGERGAVTKIHNDVHEHDKFSQNFRPGDSWSTLEEKFTVRFKNRELKDVKATHRATLIIAFELIPPEGFLFLDEIKLIPQV